MEINNIAIIGNFGNGSFVADGQVIKTKEIKHSLEKYTNKKVMVNNTYNWKKHPFKLLFSILSAFRKNDALIMMVAHNGVKVFSFLLTFLNCFFKKRLFYSVIGGWLPSLIESNKKLRKRLKKFRGIFVETNTMKKSMENLGFENIYVVPNFKDIKPVLKNVYENKDNIYEFCIFSRISKPKGVDDAINAISLLSKKYNNIKLNIYGSVVDEFKEEFNEMVIQNSNCVVYHGCAPFDKSVDVLKEKYLLIFPTKSFTEGIPGTIIDAYTSSLPVLCSKWESYSDIVNDNVGYFYEFGDFEDLVKKLEYCILNPKMVDEKKKNCYEEAFKYSSKLCINKMIGYMEN